MKRRSVLWTGVLALAFAFTFALGVLPAAAQSTGTISGIAYSDSNGNGIRETGENGVEGVQFTIASGSTSSTVTSAADGSFSASVVPGTWTVTVASVPSGYYDVDDNSTEVTVGSAGDTVSNVEFAIVPSTTDANGEVLPASGGFVSGPVLLGGLALLLVLGAVLVIAGRRGQRD